MKRLLIIVLLALFLVTTALLGGYLYLSSQDAEQIRRKAERDLEAALGRDVALKGPLSVTLSPLPTVTISDVTVGNASWGSKPEMLSVKELQLIPDLKRLLLGRIELRQVRISGAQLFLENGPDGQGNWQFKSAGGSPTGRLPVRILSVTIDDLHAAYLNPAAGMTREITLDRLRMGSDFGQSGIRLEIQGQVLKQALAVDGHLGRFTDLMAGNPFPVDLKATIGQTSLTITGQIDDPDFRDYNGIHLHFNANGKEPVVLMGWTRISMPPLQSFSISSDLEGQGGKLAARNLQAHLAAAGYDMQFSGSVEDLPALEGLAIDFHGSGDTITQIMPWSDQPFTAKGKFLVDGHLSGTMTAPRLDSVKMSGEFPGVTMSLAGSVTDFHEGGRVDAAVSFRGTGLGAVGERLHVSIPDIEGVDLDGRLSGTLIAPALEDIKATLTQGSLKATVTGSIPKLIPTEDVELAFDLTGGDFADIGQLIGVSGLPSTDTAVADGLVRGSAGDMRIVINNGHLKRKDGTALSATGDITGIGAGTTPRLNLDMRLTGTNVRALDTTAGSPIPDTQAYDITGTLTGSAVAPDLVDVDATASLDRTTVTVKGRFPDVLKFQQMDVQVAVNGDDLSDLGRKVGQTWPRSRAFSFRGRVHDDVQHPRIDALTGRLTTDQGEINFSGQVDDVMGGAGFALEVDAKADSLSAFFPLGGHVWDALGDSSARFSISGDITKFRVVLAEMHAGNSSFTGEFTYSKAAPDQPRRIDGAFRESVLDLTPWLIGDEEGSDDDSAGQTARQRPAAPFFSTAPFDLGWMRALELDVDLSAIELSAGKDRLDLVHGKLGLSGALLTLDPMDLDYEGSTVAGSLSLDGSETPHLNLQARTKDLNFGQLAQRAGLSDDAKGLIDMKLSLDATGTSPHEMASTATGQMAMLMTAGFVGGKELPLHFGEIFLHLMPWAKDQPGIVINCGMLDLPLAGGIAAMQLFVLDTKDMLMRGEGKIDLGKETYDLLLIPRAKHARALAHKVDVRIVGKLGHPEIRYDAAAAGINALEAAGRFALLGPAGLFINPDMFKSQRQQCAESLEQVQTMK